MVLFLLFPLPLPSFLLLQLMVVAYLLLPLPLLSFVWH
jgi:hypothetical protein